MAKTIALLGGLLLGVAAPALAQDPSQPVAPSADAPASTMTPPADAPASPMTSAAPMTFPKCSAKVTDSCNQGANNPKAMTAAQAEASGGVGNRRDDVKTGAARSRSIHKRTMRHKMKTTTTETSTSTPM